MRSSRLEDFDIKLPNTMIELYDTISDDLGRSITKAYSTSFSVAVSVLPSKKRKAIYSIYAFVRIADEIVDTFLFADQDRLLTELETDLATALEMQCSSNPILHSFVRTIEEYDIDLQLVYDFLKSMRTDLTKSVYSTEEEKNEYIYGSAEVVGLMCLQVFLEGNMERFDELSYSARRLGAAFQKINFLRDLKQDHQELGRSYFPSVEFEHLSEHQKVKIEEEIEEDLRIAYKGIVALPHDCKIAVYIAYRYFTELFKKLKRTPANGLMEARIRINNGFKGFLFAKSLIKWQLHLIVE